MKYLIIGAVAGGASAAARLRRLDEHAEIVIFEKGRYISYANCGLPYYIGDVITDRQKLLVQTAEAFNQRFCIDVRIQTEVLAIHPQNKTVTAKNLQTGETYTETYDKLLLSPGAEPVRPPLPSINLPGIFTLRNVTDTDYIKAYVNQRKAGKAVIIGAGFIGLEMAENLHALGMQVNVVEMGKQVLAPLDDTMAAMVQQHLRQHGLQLHLNTAVTGFEQLGEQLTVKLNDGDDLVADVVILSIGVRPDVRLAKEAGLSIDASGGIAVNEYLQTSNPDIYAVGDAIAFRHPQSGQNMPIFLAGPANKQGRISANNMALGNKQAYKGATGTAIVKVFNLTVATTGMAAKNLQKAGIAHHVSLTHHASHAGYYPGAQAITIQLTFSPDNGLVLGAQIVGYDGVDKRIDVLSALINQGATIEDLTEFEQAYAPPYSSAKDPVNMAGFVAENLLLGRLEVFHWNAFPQLGSDDILLDVRTPAEFALGNIPGAINIEIDQLRQHLHQLNANNNIYIYCEAGMRGYLAQQILRQRGFKSVKNLSGGYKLWKICTAEQQLQKAKVLS